MNLVLDHVSILVGSVDAASRLFVDSGIKIGQKESFGDVGTEEIYIGDSESRALLLLQAAVANGVYMRALQKRGPGIHHVAVCSNDFSAANEKLSGLGWLVHPGSLRNYKQGATLFYVRPGVGTILELITTKEAPSGHALISEVMVHTDSGKENYVDGIGIPGLNGSNAGEPYLVIHGRRWNVDEIANVH